MYIFWCLLATCHLNGILVWRLCPMNTLPISDLIFLEIPGNSLQRISCVMTQHCPIFSMIRLVQATHKMDCVIQCFCLYSQPGSMNSTRESARTIVFEVGRIQVPFCELEIAPQCVWELHSTSAKCSLLALRVFGVYLLLHSFPDAKCHIMCLRELHSSLVPSAI